jgi:hypothetical protein
MKKQVKVIIGILVAIAILIVGISLFYPTVFKGLTSGTFGKAEKYHKQQMAEKDILLRSELVADTGKLKNMIQGLIYFSLFTRDLSNNIDSCVDKYRSKGICTDPNRCASVSALQDFSDFIRNNNKTLATTIRLLTAFYLKDNSDESADVEKNLRDFGIYVNNLNEKDSVLNLALRSMDNFMLSDKTLKTKKTELTSLKSIRDQLLLQGVQLSGLLQDKPLTAQLIGYALSSQQALNVIVLGKEQLGTIASHEILSKDQLGSFLSEEKLTGYVESRDVAFGSNVQLGEILQAQQLGLVNSKQDLGNMVGSVMVYNRDNMQFVVGNIAGLQQVLSSSQITAILQGSAQLGNLTGVAVFSSQGVNLYQSNIDLNSIYQSQQGDLGMILSNSQLNQVLSGQQGLGLLYSSDFIHMVGDLGNMGLGVQPIEE